MKHPKTYAITHCYTDLNKGDAAIIQSTISLLRRCDPMGKINLYSTFGPKDQRFSTEHNHIKTMGDELYPALLSTPEIPRWLPFETARALPFIINLIQSLLLLVSAHPKWIALFSRGRQAEGIRKLAQTDIIISKGGSYLTSQNRSLRQAISLFTMLYPFLFAIRYSRPCVIFSQSLGPVHGRINHFLFHQILKKVNKIYIREDLCLKEYESVQKLNLNNKMKVIPDTAFYYEAPSVDWCGSSGFQRALAKFDSVQLKIGITLVDHAFKYISDAAERDARKSAYVKSILDFVSYANSTYGAQIHIFPQVSVNNSHEGHNDIILSRIIVDSCNEDARKNLYFHDDDFSPTELRELYRHMDIFIGTRLHSVIFATSCGCPSINISYHGTKSQGIFNRFQSLENSVISIDDITSDELITKMDYLMANRAEIRRDLLKETSQFSAELLVAMKSVANLA